MPEESNPPLANVALYIIQNTWSTKTLKEQSEYIHKHSDFYANDMDTLMNAIERQYARMNIEPTPQNCSRIAEIYIVYTEQGNGFRISPTSITHPLDKYCQLASQKKVGLLTYLTEDMLMEEPYDVKYVWKTPQIERVKPQFRKNQRVVRTYESPEERPQRTNAKREINVDLMAAFSNLLRELNENISELRNAIASNRNDREVEELRQRINRLENRKENFAEQFGKTLNLPEEEIKEKTYIANSYEWGLYLRKVTTLPETVTVSARKLGRGEYEITFHYKTEDELTAINNLIGYLNTENSKYEEERRSYATGRARVSGPVIDALCQAWMAQSGNSTCGISREGALATLANRIVEYLESLGEPGTVDIQNYMKYIYEIDLFAEKGQKVYTREQADEAFNVFVKNVSGAMLESRVGTKNAINSERCDPILLLENLVTYDALTVIEQNLREVGQSLPENYVARRNDAIEELTVCDVYPNGLERERDNLSGIASQYYHMDYNEYLQYTISAFMDEMRRKGLI